MLKSAPFRNPGYQDFSERYLRNGVRKGDLNLAVY